MTLLRGVDNTSQQNSAQSLIDHDAAPSQDSPNDVEAYASKVTDAYKSKGASGATALLAQAARDPNLTADERKELLTKLHPITDKIAKELGENARRTNLPAGGKANQTTGIDDKQEYQTTVTALAAAVQFGNADEASRIATNLLNFTPAADDGRTDGLGLLGESLRALGPVNPVLRSAIIAQLKTSPPQNATTGSELALPAPTRESVATALTVPVSAPYKVPDGNDLPALRAYSDWAVTEAIGSQKVADDMGAPFKNGKKPADDPMGYELFKARNAAAIADRSRAEQAITAELRAAYQGAPRNKSATETAARDLTTRLNALAGGNDPFIQSTVSRALNTVLTESAEARETDGRLYDVHRADDKLNSLIVDKQSGKTVSDADLQSSIDGLSRARQNFQSNLSKEFDSVLAKVPNDPAIDRRVVAAENIGSRFAGDAELKVALQAEVILRTASDATGPEAQMIKLGELMPAHLDPTARAYALSDVRGESIVNNFNKWASTEVKAAYDNAVKSYGGYQNSLDYRNILVNNTPPALAATQRLRELTDSIARPYVKPQMVAQIFNQLRNDQTADTKDTLARVMQDLSLDTEWGTLLLRKDSPDGPDPRIENKTYAQTIVNLSLAADNMGRAQDLQSGRYGSPEIQTEIEYLGRTFAQDSVMLRAPQHPMAQGVPPHQSRYDVAFRTAAGQGSVVLGLETARQLTLPGMQFDKVVYAGWTPTAQANVTLQSVTDGIADYQKNTEVFFDRMNEHMAPISSPLARFGMSMTPEQQQAAVDEILNKTTKGPEVRANMMADRRELDLRGHQLLRLGETVGFYEKSIGNLESFSGVKEARKNLFTSDVTTPMTLLSNTATFAAGAKIALGMIDPDHARGHVQPQKYSWIAQGADMAEYLAETYLLKLNAHDFRFRMPADLATTLEPKFKLGAPGNMASSPYDASRLGRVPLLGLGVWGIGGGYQVALTSYLYDEVGFDPQEQWRKPVLLGLVGGFAAFHLFEAGAIGARAAVPTWQAMKNAGMVQWLDSAVPPLYQSLDHKLAQNTTWATFNFSATKNLTAALAGLMGIAAVWDLSGVVYRGIDVYEGKGDPSHGALGSPWWKVATHGANAASDLLLLRLQVREYASRVYPEIVATKGAQSLAARRAAWWATSATLNAIDRVPFVLNPIGMTVNVAYLAMTGLNFYIDQSRYIADLETYDNAFLRGAGVHAMQADVLKQHAWWTGDGQGDGFALGYIGVGGDPAKFVDYLNQQTDRDKLEAAILAGSKLPGSVQPSGLNKDDPRAAYLAIPDENPTDFNAAMREKFTNIYLNPDNGRYQARGTDLYFDQDSGVWIESNPLDGIADYYVPRTLTQLVLRPGSKYDSGVDMGRYEFAAPTGAEGWKAYLWSHDMLPEGLTYTPPQ